MQNRPFHPLTSAKAASPIDVSGMPTVRLSLLAVVLCLPVPLVAVRVGYVQGALRGRYVAAWERTEEIPETIRARAGRILSQDGAVLAFDQTHYDLVVHYRWLEQPMDKDWLRNQARRRLPSRFRRDAEQLEEAEQQILAEREALWVNLSAITEVPKVELIARAKEIQDRVERIVASVEARRAESSRQTSQVRALSLDNGWRGVWTALASELTTPPRRQSDDPLIVLEELDHHQIVEHVPLKIAGVIHSYPHQFPGVRVDTAVSRIYPEGDLAAHTIGLRRAPNASSAEVARVHPQGGVEQQYHAALAGVDGIETKVVARRGQVVKVQQVRPVQDGAEVVLTLNSQLQQAAELSLDELVSRSPDAQADVHATGPAGGVIIVMDIWTGDLLALAAAPRLSQTLLQHPTTEQWEAVLSDSRSPLFPRATQMSLPPGPLFQLISAIAGVESGAIAESETLFCRGFLDELDSHQCHIYTKNGGWHGELSVQQALSHSCSIFCLQLARKMSPEQLDRYVNLLGMTTRTGVDLPTESAGQMPDLRESHTKSPHERDQMKMQVAIGQSGVTTTPLQVARLCAAIGNGGYLVTPRIVQTIRTASTTSVGANAGTASNAQLHRIEKVSEQTLGVVRAAMIDAVEQGNGQNARVEGIRFGGIPATARVSGPQADHAWFAGFVPATTPRYAYVIALEHGESGEVVAATLARDLVQTMAQMGLVRSPLSDFGTAQSNPD